MRFNRKSVLSGLFVLMFVFLAGCGGKAGGTTEPTPPNPPAAQKTITFTASGTPSNNSVYLKEVIKNNDEITLAVNVKGGTNVYGTAIEITFDGNKIGYVSTLEGNYINQGNSGTTTFSAGLEQGSSGVLLIGIDKKGIATGVSGDGTLCQIILRALADQTGTSVSFNTANSSLKSPSGNIAGTSFSGGSISYK